VKGEKLKVKNRQGNSSCPAKSSTIAVNLSIYSVDYALSGLLFILIDLIAVNCIYRISALKARNH
jgi:hypothetical protein